VVAYSYLCFIKMDVETVVHQLTMPRSHEEKVELDPRPFTQKTSRRKKRPVYLPIPLVNLVHSVNLIIIEIKIGNVPFKIITILLLHIDTSALLQDH